MNENLRNSLVGILVIALLAFCVTDCSMGTHRYCPGIIRQHVYHAPYTTLSCTSDKHGPHCHTVYHPAQYRLLIECQQPHHVADINVGLTWYTLKQDGQSVLVGERIGRWSHIIWNDWIDQDYD